MAEADQSARPQQGSPTPQAGTASGSAGVPDAGVPEAGGAGDGDGQDGPPYRGRHRRADRPVVSDTPTVIVDDLHVVYRVFARRRRKESAPAALRRLLTGQQPPAMREVHALRGVSLVCHKGESIGLIGRNGSGKSTLLRAIAGLLPPTQGSVYAEGRPSLLGVHAALLNDLSGERNVRLGCLAQGMTPEEVDEAYDDIVEFSGLGDFIDLPMRTYSSGMQQRLRFAIAAARTHDVMLVDEALATGDREFRRRSERRIRKMRAEAGSVFLVSHSLNVVRKTCTRAIWLDKGTIRMDGSPAKVIRAYNRSA